MQDWSSSTSKSLPNELLVCKLTPYNRTLTQFYLPQSSTNKITKEIQLHVRVNLTIYVDLPLHSRRAKIDILEFINSFIEYLELVDVTKFGLITFAFRRQSGDTKFVGLLLVIA